MSDTEQTLTATDVAVPQQAGDPTGPVPAADGMDAEHPCEPVFPAAALLPVQDALAPAAEPGSAAMAPAVEEDVQADLQEEELAAVPEPASEDAGTEPAEGLTVEVLERLRLMESVVIHATDSVLVTEADPIDLVHGGPRIVYVNESFTRMTGHTLADVIGKTPHILQHPDTDRDELERIRVALRERKPVEAELLNRRADGSDFWVWLSITPMTDTQGYVTHWVSMQRDVTDHKQREERLRAGVQNANDLALVLDVHGRVQAASPSVQRLLGYQPQEVVGIRMSSLLHGEDAEPLAEGLAVEPELAVGPVTVRALHRSGSWRFLEATFTGAHDRSYGQVVLLSAPDVTDRVAAQQRFRSAFDDAPIGMGIARPDGTLLQVNASLARMLKTEPEQLRWTPLQELVSASDVVGVVRWLRDLIDGGRTVTLSTRLLRPEASPVEVHLSASVVTGATGLPEHLVVHAEDVSQGKALELLLRH